MFSLIAHCMAPARHDFMEMLLHHVSTVLLLSGSYLMNYLPVAALILLIHDIADIFVYGARLFLDTKYVSVAFMSYLGLLTAFIYGRLIVFPFWLIWYAVWFNYDYYQEVPGFWLMAVMLHFLLLLHIYWFFLLLGLGYNYVFKGKATDMHGAKD
jgi:ceramide synthetase